MKKLLLMKTVLLLFALVVGSGSVWADKYVKITSSSDLVVDAEYLLVSGTKAYGGISSNSGTQVDVTFNDDDDITDISDAHVLKLGGSSNAWTFYDETDEKYLAYTQTATSGTSYNRLYQVDNSTDNGATWTLSVSNTAVSFKNNYNTGRWIRSNSGYFRCYYSANSESATGSAVTLYKKTSSGGGSNPSISANPTSLSTFTYVVGNGPSAAQTISVSGSNLTANLSLSLGESSNYEMCLTADGSYTNSLSLTPTTGTVSATNVYVRLKSGLTAGEKNGTITLTSTDASDATVSLSGNVTTLGVTYDDNGADSGTVPTDATAYSYNAEVTVLGNTGSLAKAGHSFGGWNTSATGDGTNYSAGDKFNITANTTLYAKWTINSHTVTLPATDAFGEYTMNKTNDVAYGTEVTLTYTPASGYENYTATWSVNGEKISGNKFNMPDDDVTVTVSLNEVFDMTLTNSNIVSAGDAADSYASYSITDNNSKTWNAYAIKKAHSGATSSYHFLQIKKYASSTAYYVQVPEYGRKITKLEITVSGSSKAMDGGGNSATLFFSADNTTSATGTGVASGTGASKVTIDCSSLNLNTGYITASGAVRIWDVKVTYDPIRLNGSGYATYAGLTPIDYSDDSKFSAWAITEISRDAITFSKITGSVPAGTGVLLMGTAGQAVEPVVAASGTEITNKLVGITTATAVAADTYYGLSGNQFKKVGAGTVSAGKALLPANEVPASARELNFVFDEATGIKQVETSKSIIEGIYNLAGQKVQNPTKGLYIMNGKKVIIK